MPRLTSNPSLESARTDLDQHGNVVESAPETPKTTRRSTRSMQNRSKDSRVTEERPPVSYSMGSKFNLPKSLVENMRKAGYEPGWIVYSRGKEEDKENYFDAIDREYQCVPASEAPELARRYEMNIFTFACKTALA